MQGLLCIGTSLDLITLQVYFGLGVTRLDVTGIVSIGIDLFLLVTLIERFCTSFLRLGLTLHFPLPLEELGISSFKLGLVALSQEGYFSILVGF